MRVIREYDSLPDAHKGGALAIGNFDGLHLGHRAVIAAMKERALAIGVPPAVMTFEPHPRMFFRPHQPPYRIEPLHRKLRRLALAGVELLYLMRFNRALAEMSADRFIHEILKDKLGTMHVITGEEFVFGHGRSGSSETLRNAHAQGVFGYSSVPEVRLGGEICSSSSIRAHLSAGEMAQAAMLLGRAYEISGHVRHGQARGRTLGAPTANLGLHELFLPRYGVYAVRYRVSEGTMHEEGRQWKDGVANLGVRPSFGGGEPSLEVHGFDEDRSLYGKRIRVRLLEFLRDEEAFATPQALREQIVRDITRAKEALAGC